MSRELRNACLKVYFKPSKQMCVKKAVKHEITFVDAHQSRKKVKLLFLSISVHCLHFLKCISSKESTL